MGFCANNYSFTGLTSAISFGSAQTIFTPTTTGVFLIGAYVENSATGTVDTNLKWTDENGSQLGNGPTTASSNTSTFALLYVRATSNNPVSFYTSVSGTVNYNVYFTVLQVF